MSTYLLNMRGIEGNVVFKYTLMGDLELVEIKCKLESHQVKYILSTLPVREEDVHDAYNGTEKITIIASTTDLSFETFWEKYNYKVGKKERSKAIWKLMSEEDKIKAIESIAKYNKFLGPKNIDKCYPETYLSQRRWENQY